MSKYDEFIADDIKYVWHPDTQMKEYELPGEKPIIIDRGEGIYLYDINGKRYIDAVASWWVNTLGHNNKRLNEALKKQVDKLEHVLFAGFTHVGAINLAKSLVEMTCPKLTRVFYSDNGSTATEVALKMAYQYWYQKGHPEKSKFVALKNAYHGDTLGAVSVGSIGLYTTIFKPIMFESIQVQNPCCYRCPCGKNKHHCNIECISFVEELFKAESENIAAIIVEPLVQGAGGMNIYPAEYIKKLRTLCDKYNILLIHDEVAMGFGRTGKMFAYEHAQIEPDILCLAKGITAGYLPLAVTMASEEIYSAFYDNYETGKAFYHGHSYTANPLAVSIANENIKILKEDNIIEQVQDKSKIMQSELVKLSNLEFVGDVRQVGLVVAIELVKNKETKEPFTFAERIGYKVYKKALELGAILRPVGNIIYFMPPYVISPDEIKTLVNITYESIKSLGEKLNKN